MIRCPVAHSAKPTSNSNPASSIVFHLLFITCRVAHFIFPNAILRETYPLPDA
jgi:hypothetical protein